MEENVVSQFDRDVSKIEMDTPAIPQTEETDTTYDRNIKIVKYSPGDLIDLLN